MVSVWCIYTYRAFAGVSAGELGKGASSPWSKICGRGVQSVFWWDIHPHILPKPPPLPPSHFQRHHRRLRLALSFILVAQGR